MVSNFNNDNILEFERATGAFVGEFIPSMFGGLNEPVAITFGPDGDLYVSSFANDQVIRYDGITGDFIEVFVTASTVAESALDQVSRVFGAECGDKS